MQKIASVPSNETAAGTRLKEPTQSHSRKPHKWRVAFSSLRQRTRSIVYGVVAAAILTLLIAVGSQRFHWFDEALIGYAVATIFAVVAVTYKYSLWLARPPTGRYWQRSWQLFLSYKNIRRYGLLIPKAIFANRLSQQCLYAFVMCSAVQGRWQTPLPMP